MIPVLPTMRFPPGIPSRQKPHDPFSRHHPTHPAHHTQPESLNRSSLGHRHTPSLIAQQAPQPPAAPPPRISYRNGSKNGIGGDGSRLAARGVLSAHLDPQPAHRTYTAPKQHPTPVRQPKSSPRSSTHTHETFVNRFVIGHLTLGRLRLNLNQPTHLTLPAHIITIPRVNVANPPDSVCQTSETIPHSIIPYSFDAPHAPES